MIDYLIRADFYLWEVKYEENTLENTSIVLAENETQILKKLKKYCKGRNWSIISIKKIDERRLDYVDFSFYRMLEYGSK